MHSAWVYILTNSHRTVLYVGVTTCIGTRVWEHATKQDPGSFTCRYNVQKLIYYEGFYSIIEAIKREKYIKGKSRRWKDELIHKVNPEWRDLSPLAKSL
jgi:putative endonuclease